MGHGIKYNKPAEIIEWLLESLVPGLELNEQVGDAYEYGRTFQFRQRGFARSIGSSL